MTETEKEHRRKEKEKDGWNEESTGVRRGMDGGWMVTRGMHLHTPHACTDNLR